MSCWLSASDRNWSTPGDRRQGRGRAARLIANFAPDVVSPSGAASLSLVPLRPAAGANVFCGSKHREA